MLGAEVAANEIAEGLNTALLLLVLAAGVSWIANQYHYYQPFKFPPIWRGAIPLVDVFGAFLIFFGFQLILVPSALILGFWIYNGSRPDLHVILTNLGIEGWINLLSMLLTLFLLLAYTRFIGKSELIWNRQGKKFSGLCWDATIGAITWLVSYPLVTAVGQFITVLIVYLYGEAPADQAAVSYLKSLSHKPMLFWLTGITMATVIPVSEELIFRGFLQNWIVGNFGRVIGIVSTSLIFASFHMSRELGIHNIALVAPLFLLSCYLGYVYERQQSLWAPIGLHSVFNSISLAALFSTQE